MQEFPLTSRKKEGKAFERCVVFKVDESLNTDIYRGEAKRLLIMENQVHEISRSSFKNIIYLGNLWETVTGNV